MSITPEDALIEHATRIVDQLSKPTYVFRMARANPNSPSSRKRMINAAREIVEATRIWPSNSLVSELEEYMRKPITVEEDV